MASIMRISEMYDKDVFTDAGRYFGKVSDVVLGKFMIHGWVIRATPQSLLKESLGDVRAVIVPHKAVKAIGDIMIISQHIELGRKEEEEMPDNKPAPAPMAAEPAPQPPARRSPFRF